VLTLRYSFPFFHSSLHLSLHSSVSVLLSFPASLPLSFFSVSTLSSPALDSAYLFSFLCLL
jgi:hypothetical protein